MQTQTVKASEIKAILKQTNGRFFGFGYVKANGENRTGAGRFGVSYTNRTGRTVSTPDNIVKYWDSKRKAYRSFRLDRLQFVTVNGVRYQVVHEVENA